MTRTCTVCRHRQRTEIDAALAQLAPFRDIAVRFGVSPAAIGRHKAHAETAATSDSALTASERRQLIQIGELRLKRAKKQIEARAAGLLGDFESTLRTFYSPDNDEVMRRLTSEARDFVTEHDGELAQRCLELGIPEEYRPRLSLSWRSQGYALDDKLSELRKEAATRVNAMRRAALAELEERWGDIHEAILTGGLASLAANTAAASLPSAEALLPSLTFADVARDNRRFALLSGFYEATRGRLEPLALPTESAPALLGSPAAEEGGAR